MYTPQFSDSASISIRRLAWALNSNMPAAVNRLIQLLPSLFEPGLICQRCKDQSKCRLCAFSKHITSNDIAELLTL
jgi:recombinational DNA repair protein RecR